MNPHPWVYLRDDTGTVHLGARYGLGPQDTECDYFGRTEEVEPVAEADLCSDCSEYYL